MVHRFSLGGWFRFRFGTSTGLWNDIRDTEPALVVFGSEGSTAMLEKELSTDGRPRVSVNRQLPPFSVSSGRPSSLWAPSHHSHQSSSQDRVTEPITENSDCHDIVQLFQMHLLLIVHLAHGCDPLCTRATCKCCFIDDPLSTELVDNWWTGRMETRSITLALHLWR